MNDALRYLRGMDPPDRAYIRALHHAFGVPEEGADRWLATAGLENLRALIDDDGFAAGLLVIPMGQFFLGRSVPMWGVAGVAVPPLRRGDGVGAALMRATLREMHERGVALSTLYASTVPVYRGVGYETAGCLWTARAPIRAIRRRPAGAAVAHELTPADLPAVETLHREHAATRNGHLDRGPYVWRKVREPRGETSWGFGVEEDGRLTGYLYFTRRKPGDRERHDVHLLDYVARTADADAALNRIIANEFSMAVDVVVPGGPDHPLSLALPDHGYSVHLREPWMLRVVDLAAAIGARGFPPGLTAALEIELDDPVIEANRGRFTLRVEGGRGTVERAPGPAVGPPPPLRLDVGALASLYSGFRSAEILALAGRAHGDPETLALATQVFAAPAPELSDFF